MSDKPHDGWRARLGRIIFGVDTPAGKLFDIVLLWAIVVSVVLVILESVSWIRADYAYYLDSGEWFFTALFTIEYILRIISSGNPFKYIFSFYGIIDLICVVPTYIGVFATGAESLLAVRTIRLLRVFRVLKLVRYLKAVQAIVSALRHSREKIIVFLVAVLGIATIMGTIMYIIEDPEAGFTSIPRSIYWAIVTMTTVGYGDISPVTPLGQTLASVLMVMGYAIIAVPTGIVSAEAVIQSKAKKLVRKCRHCDFETDSESAQYCENCGKELN